MSFAIKPLRTAALCAAIVGASFAVMAGSASAALVPAAWVPFVNGSGSTPSRLVFNNTHIGEGVMVTGSLDVKLHPSGGLTTLN